MWQQFLDAVVVHDRQFGGVVNRGLHVELAYLLTHEPGKFVVDGVSGSRCDDASLDGSAYQCHIANDVEQLVAGRFVVPDEGFVLDVSEHVGVAVFHTCLVTKLVEGFLCGLPFVDDDGVVEVASLHQSCHEQGFYLANEDEGASSSNLRLEVLHAVECGKLTADELRLEVDHRRKGEILVRQECDAGTRFFVLDFCLARDDIVVLCRILFLDAHATNLFHVGLRTTVEDGKLGTIDLDEYVVDTQCIEGCHTVFDGAYLDVLLSEYRASGGLDDILCHCLKDGLLGQVDTLYLIPVVLWGGIERHSQVQSRV